MFCVSRVFRQHITPMPKTGDKVLVTFSSGYIDNGNQWVIDSLLRKRRQVDVVALGAIPVGQTDCS